MGNHQSSPTSVAKYSPREDDTSFQQQRRQSIRHRNHRGNLGDKISAKAANTTTMAKYPPEEHDGKVSTRDDVTKYPQVGQHALRSKSSTDLLEG